MWLGRNRGRVVGEEGKGGGKERRVVGEEGKSSGGTRKGWRGAFR